jgi:tRNA-Thr(GGU) m(6)t(6)A37 methyltransferase TsaA
MTLPPLTAIGRVRSPFIQLFGTPRQAGLVSAVARIDIEPQWQTGLDGLAGFSHVWVVWIFDRNKAPGRARVRPPRLDGETKLGVFATRSPYRPNPIGLSVARLRAVHADHVEVEGLDVVDGTPVIDLKPYLPYADAVPDATAGWADSALPAVPVRFAEPVAAQLEQEPQLSDLIQQTFGLDPRPARHRRHPVDKLYAVRLGAFDVRARLDDTGWVVVAVEAVS